MQSNCFNLFKWIPREDVPNDILSFVNENNPDVYVSKSTLLRLQQMWILNSIRIKLFS